MGLDLEAIRADTPATARIAHLNNAGAALPPRQVVDAVVDYLRHEEETGGYEAAVDGGPALVRTYAAVARLLGCDPDEVALAESATWAWSMAFHGIGFKPGDRILTGRAEYTSNYIAFLHAARTKGVTIDVVPDDEHGRLDVGALEAMVDDRTRLISVVHVPTNDGMVSPAAEVGAVARRTGVLYLLDACQSAGQLPLDVDALGCDLLSFTGRKWLRGPRGTGALYVRRDRMAELDPPMPDMRGADWTGRDSYRLRPDARRFEQWESYLAGRVGLGVAVEYALAIGLDAIWARVQELATALRARLAAVPGVTLADTGPVQSGIVTFEPPGADARALQDRLRKAGVNVSVASGGLLYELPERARPEKIRASVHYYNTEADLDRLVAELR